MPNTRVTKISPISGIIIGFLLFEFSGVFQILRSSDRILKLLGLTLIFFSAFSSKKWKLTGKTRNYLFLLFVVEITMILIGILELNFRYDPFDGSLRNFLRDLLFFTHSPLTLLIPLAAFLPLSKNDLNQIKTIAIIVICIQILAVILNWKEIFSGDIMGRTSYISKDGEYVTIRQLVMNIFSGAGMIAFLSWNKCYLKSTSYIFLILGLFLAFLGIASGGGRGTSAVVFGYIITAILLGNSKSKYKALEIFILLIITVILIIYLYKNTSIFSFLLSRLFVDESYSTLQESSREYFTKALIADFNAHPLAWIFGRGIFGAYRLPNGEYRQWMEWGFLYQILKGGIIYLTVYISILLYSFKKAFFDSNNTLCKAMGCLCLWQVLELIPFGLPSMTAKYFLVWWFVGIISKKRIREMNDNEIMLYFNKQQE